MAEVEKITIDEMFSKLENVVENLEKDDVSLEQAFLLYEEGVKLAGSLTKGIDLVEKKVLLLTEGGETHEFS